MSNMTLTGQTWVAYGPAGVIGSIHRVEDGFTFKLVSDSGFRAVYPSLDVAKSALHASLAPGADRPEFLGHQ